MKGKISNIEKSQITMKDGTMKEKFSITFEGDDKTYESWSCSHKVGDEVDGEVSAREWNNKTFYSIKFAGGAKGGAGGFSRAKSPDEVKAQARSFSLSYGKDVTVAFIEKGIIVDSKAADASILHFSNLFKGILEG